ncbi:hypothetical protein D3C76_680590 [compost metagenome]
MPEATVSFNSSSVAQIPPPVPPSVYAGRTITGYPISLANCTASSTVVIIVLSGTGCSNSRIKSRNRSRSSAFSMEVNCVPSNFTFSRSSTPARASSTAIFKPVCPPSVGSKPSGRSWRMIWVTKSRVIGSIYTLSAIFVSVIIVAGLLLISTTSTPSSLSAWQA